MAGAQRKLGVFPAFHDLRGRVAVVVGGGDEAAAKVRLLSETVAEIHMYAPAPGAEAREAIRTANAVWHGRDPEPRDFSDVALIFIATGTRQRDEAIARDARAAGVPVNVVDRPDLCDFHTPALVNRAPLAIAVGSEGVAPVLTRHVRARIEAFLAPAFGDLAALAQHLRTRVTASFATIDERRRFWDGLFRGSVAETVFAGRPDEAEQKALRQLRDRETGAGHVSLVGAGPGAEDLLTLRAQRLLQEADVIVYDRLVPDTVVAMGRRDAERIYVGKAKGRHAMSQAAINDILVREARAGRRVVRLKSGDPLIYGRAGEEIRALRAAGVAFDIVPGITAAFAAAADNEIPLTLRGAASSLVFVTGHDADGKTLPGWSSVALAGATVAVYMGRSVAAAVARQLMAAGLSASTPVALVENASRVDGRAFAGRLDDLAVLAARPDLDGPVLILIGDVVAEGVFATASSPLRDLAA